MAAQQGSAWPVVLTENGAVDVVEAVTWNQPVPAGGASETLQRGGVGMVRKTVRKILKVPPSTPKPCAVWIIVGLGPSHPFPNPVKETTALFVLCKDLDVCPGIFLYAK